MSERPRIKASSIKATYQPKGKVCERQCPAIAHKRKTEVERTKAVLRERGQLIEDE